MANAPTAPVPFLLSRKISSCQNHGNTADILPRATHLTASRHRTMLRAMQTQTAEKPIHLTPADAINNRKELRPLPLRVAHAQYDRLNAARDRSGISIQEHVR